MMRGCGGRGSCALWACVLSAVSAGGSRPAAASGQQPRPGGADPARGAAGPEALAGALSAHRGREAAASFVDRPHRRVPKPHDSDGPQRGLILRRQPRDDSFAQEGRTGDPHDDSWMGWLFHCEAGSGFQGSLALSHALLILSAVCIIVGTVAMAFEHTGFGEGMAWEPWMEQAMLIGSVFGGTCVYLYDMVSDSMVIIGFAYCGFWVWMAIGMFIMGSAQLFQAWEFSHHGEGLVDQVKYFFLALCQCHIFLDAYESWEKQRVTPSFARHKFIEAVGEAGPQAIFCTYVIYYLDQNYNIFLVASIIGSICGLSYGISIWLQFSFQKQLEEDHIPPGIFTIRWFHHALWMSYFAMDFGLRLLTLGLFLSRDNLRPWNQIVFVLLVIVYLLAVMISTHLYHHETGIEAWQISEEETIYVQRTVVAQRVIDGLILTFFVHVLPADIRLAPKHPEESRLLFALHPDLRARIMKTIIPIRAVEYTVLGAISMWYRWNHLQCMALVAMFITMHLMLYAVLRLKQPPTMLHRPSTSDLSPEVMRAISDASKDPASPKTQSAT